MFYYITNHDVIVFFYFIITIYGQKYKLLLKPASFQINLITIRLWFRSQNQSFSVWSTPAINNKISFGRTISTILKPSSWI